MKELQMLVQRQREEKEATERIKQEEREDRRAQARQARRQATLQTMRGGSVPSVSLLGESNNVPSPIGCKRKAEVIELSDDDE